MSIVLPTSYKITLPRRRHLILQQVKLDDLARRLGIISKHVVAFGLPPIELYGGSVSALLANAAGADTVTLRDLDLKTTVPVALKDKDRPAFVEKIRPLFEAIARSLEELTGKIQILKVLPGERLGKLVRGKAKINDETSLQEGLQSPFSDISIFLSPQDELEFGGVALSDYWSLPIRPEVTAADLKALGQQAQGDGLRRLGETGILKVHSDEPFDETVHIASRDYVSQGVAHDFIARFAMLQGKFGQPMDSDDLAWIHSTLFPKVRVASVDSEKTSRLVIDTLRDLIRFLVLPFPEKAYGFVQASGMLPVLFTFLTHPPTDAEALCAEATRIASAREDDSWKIEQFIRCVLDKTPAEKRQSVSRMLEEAAGLLRIPVKIEA